MNKFRTTVSKSFTSTSILHDENIMSFVEQEISFENSRSLVQHKGRSTVIAQITKYLITSHVVYQTSSHLSKSTRCRTITLYRALHITFQSHGACMCAYLKVCRRIRLGLSVTAHSLCLHGARNSFSYNAFQARRCSCSFC